MDEPPPPEPKRYYQTGNPKWPYPDWTQYRSIEEARCELQTEGRALIPSAELGDVVGTTLIRLLESAAPYPGDPTPDDDPADDDRFLIEGRTIHLWVIRDLHRNTTCYFDVDMACHPDFQPALEYAHRCAVDSKQEVSQEWVSHQHERMGTWIEQKIEHIIENSRPYLYDADFSLRQEKRCEVYWDPDNTDHVLVEDLKQERVWYLPRQFFEDPEFDIASWYQARLLSKFNEEKGTSPFESA